MRNAILTLIVTAFSFAQASTMTPVVNIGLDFGGDEIVRANYSDGSTSTIEAGRGILVTGGATYTFAENFEAQGTLGLKWTSTKAASNGSIDFTRFPIEALGFYKNEENRFRIGGGLTYQVANKIKGSQDASAISVGLENALGYVLEGNYAFGPNLTYAAGLRYTAINYSAATGGQSVEGNSIGANFAYSWR